jgi:hypothetical protein
MGRTLNRLSAVTVNTGISRRGCTTMVVGSISK